VLVETLLLYVAGILIVAVGIALSIALHEVGHLVPAKLFGVRVGQYMIGFGKTLFSIRRGETEYGIKAIPMGGYISMSGMYPPATAGGRPRTASTGFFQTLVTDARTASAETIRSGEEKRAFYSLAIWKRIIIMLGGPFMNLVIAVVLYAVLLSGFGIAQQTTTLGTVSQCVVAQTSTKTSCAASDVSSPGAKAGLKPGDRILSINGTAMTSWDQLTSAIRKSANAPLQVVVQRGTARKTLTVTPVENAVAKIDASGNVVVGSSGKIETETAGFVGIGSTEAIVQQPLSAVIPAVWANTTQVGGVILNLPQRVVGVVNAAFGPGKRDPNGPIGLVGVGRIAGQIATTHTATISSRFASLISVVASVNVALLVFNLIPLMPLDGGHVAGALWEGIRRIWAKVFRRRDPGPVDTARVVPLTFAVVVVLGALSLLLVYADIVKPITLN
jgi:membrane-associated protease RseP (regulator of RpoE activity)